VASGGIWAKTTRPLANSNLASTATRVSVDAFLARRDLM